MWLSVRSPREARGQAFAVTRHPRRMIAALIVKSRSNSMEEGFLMIGNGPKDEAADIFMEMPQCAPEKIQAAFDKAIHEVLGR